MNGSSFGFIRMGVLVLGVVAALGLGGCSNDKEKMDTLTEQIAAITSEKEAIAQQLSQSEARRLEVEQRAASAEARANQPTMNFPPMDSPNGGATREPRNRDVVLKVAGDVAFAAGSATLNAAGRRELDGIARTIKSQYSSNRIRVEGYTDSDPIRKAAAKFSSNEALSAARASSVEKYLVSKGISSGRIDSVGRGSAKPMRTKADSRRVEIVILGN